QDAGPAAFNSHQTELEQHRKTDMKNPASEWLVLKCPQVAGFNPPDDRQVSRYERAILPTDALRRCAIASSRDERGRREDSVDRNTRWSRRIPPAESAATIRPLPCSGPGSASGKVEPGRNDRRRAPDGNTPPL